MTEPDLLARRRRCPTWVPARPTPPIALAGDPAPASARAGAAPAAVAVPDVVLDRLRAVCASVTVDAGGARRGQPRLVAARHDLGARGRGRRPGRRRRAARRPVDEVAGHPAHLQRGARSRSPRRPGAAACADRRCRSSAASSSTCATSPGSSPSTTSRSSVDVAPGTFGDHFEHELRTELRPDLRPLAPVGDAVDRRRLAGLPRCRPALDPLRQDRGHGRRTRRRPGRRHVIHTGGNPRQSSGPDLNQLFVGSEGTLGIITGARLRVHPAPTHERRLAVGVRLVRRRVSRPVVASCAAAPRPPCCGCTTPSKPIATTRPASWRCCSCSTRASRRWSTPPSRSSRRSARRPCLSMSNWSSSWIDHRNDVSRSKRLISGGFVVDTMEITGPWSALPAIYADGVAAIKAGARDAGGLGPPEPRLPRRGLPLLHVRGQARSRRQGRLLPGGVGRRDPEPCSATAARSAITTASASTGPGSWPRPSGAAHGTLGAIKAALDPNGILNPGKLGLASPFGPNPFAETTWP